MTSRTIIHRLEVASNLYHFIEDQVLPGTGISSDNFWKGFDAIVADLAPKNQALLAERLLVPELIQDAATADALAQTLAPLLDDGAVQTEGFDVIHRALRQDASQQAADAVLKLVGQA